MAISPVPTRLLSRALRKKGFLENKKADHVFYYLCYEGKRYPVRTKISHGRSGSECDKNLLSKIKRQLRLDSIEELLDFIDCPLSEEGYIAILKQKNVI